MRHTRLLVPLATSAVVRGGATLKQLFVRRPSHGTIVAYLALFVALGGTAYAANEWTGRNIVNGSLKRVDLGANSVNGNKVVNNSLKGADILESSLGTVPKAGEASSVVPGVIGTAALADGAVTPAKQAPVGAASVLKLSPETIATATGTTLHADFEIYDTANLHDTTTNSESFVAPVGGMYVVSVSVQWDANSTGYRNTTLVGPTGTFAQAIGPATASPAVTVQQLSGVERMSAGQSVHVEVLQGSGGNLNARLSRFNITYVGP
jgi:hypothetical protein